MTNGPPVPVQPPAAPTHQPGPGGVYPDNINPEQVISPEQHIAGVSKFYQQFQRAEAAYRMVNEAVHGKRRMPILRAPLGTSDAEGNMEVLEIDLHAPFDKIQDDAQRLQKIQTMLAPLNNYYATAYGQELRQVALYALNAWKIVSGQNELNSLQGLDFDSLVQMVHEGYGQFEPLWQALKSVEDGVAMNQVAKLGGVLDIDLNQLLTSAGVQPAQQQQLLQQVLGGKIAEMRKGLVPCLQQMAAAAGTAVAMLDKANATQATA